jgi:hypothetical protein
MEHRMRRPKQHKTPYQMIILAKNNARSLLLTYEEVQILGSDTAIIDRAANDDEAEALKEVD